MQADEYFAVVPESVLYSTSPRALQVYAMLRRHADHSRGDTFVGRKRLGELAGCSVDTIDRALAELVELGCLEVETRYAKGGRRTTNLYRLRSSTRDSRINAARDSRTDAADDGRTNAATSYQKPEEPQPEEPEPIEPAALATALRDVAVTAEIVVDDLTVAQQRRLEVTGTLPSAVVERAGNRKAQHDANVYALIDACGYLEGDITKPEWGRVHKAAKHLTDVHASPDEIKRRAKLYLINFPGAALTPTAIASRWQDIARPRVGPTRREIAGYTERQRTDEALQRLKARNE